MKRTISHYIIAITAAGIVTAGCGKKLDQVNPNAQTSGTFWQTGNDALQGINAAYAPMLLDGAYMRFTPILLDVRGDDIRSNSPWTAISGIGKFALGTGNADGYGWAFDEYYEGIFRCNQVLDNVPAINMDNDLRNRVLGQAYFLRGLYFFHLVNMFGNVALPTSTPQSKADFYGKQTTQTEGWQQVIADFKAAADLLPVTYKDISGADANQIGRATKGAAMGYLGKAYLFNKMYQEAAEQFKKVIDLGVYQLMPDYKDNFTESRENNAESIFEIQFSTTAGGTDLGWQGIPTSTWAKTSARAITYGPPSFGWTDVQPTVSVFNEFMQEKTVDGETDPRLDATMFYNKPGEMIYGQPFAQVYANSSYLTDIFCRKYQNGDGNKANEYDWKSGINERLMRYSDILLMYAECLNELGQTAQAAPYIQQVRTRAKLPDITTAMAALSKTQMQDRIAHERLLEFCLEGHRFDDIRRWGWLDDADKLAMLKSRDPEFNNYKPGKQLYPIPQGEIDNNPGFKQNPSY
jgi:tetratricopeptide (TPR) repeat protein